MNLNEFKAYIDSFDELCTLKNLDSKNIPVKILMVNSAANKPITIEFNSVVFKNNEICIM